jgi:hypothetical protein
MMGLVRSTVDGPADDGALLSEAPETGVAGEGVVASEGVFAVEVKPFGAVSLVGSVVRVLCRDGSFELKFECLGLRPCSSALAAAVKAQMLKLKDVSQLFHPITTVERLPTLRTPDTCISSSSSS